MEKMMAGSALPLESAFRLRYNTLLKLYSLESYDPEELVYMYIYYIYAYLSIYFYLSLSLYICICIYIFTYVSIALQHTAQALLARILRPGGTGKYMLIYLSLSIPLYLFLSIFISLSLSL